MRKTTSAPLKFQPPSKGKSYWGMGHGPRFFPLACPPHFASVTVPVERIFSFSTPWLYSRRAHVYGREGVFPVAHNLVLMLPISQTKCPQIQPVRHRSAAVTGGSSRPSHDVSGMKIGVDWPKPTTWLS